MPQQKVYISATPADLERARSGRNVAELVVRPTGLVDPAIEVKPLTNQVDDLIGEIRKRADRSERVLVTTLTKVMAEELTAYLADAGIRVRYLHSEITTLERTEIIRELRLGKFDALVGINLLREGLDIPECSLVAVLDADKEGFLRSTTSLIQTCGRAARNVNGTVILYADQQTASIKAALDECDRRRRLQLEFNRVHGVTPTSIVKGVPASMRAVVDGESAGADSLDPPRYAGTLVELPIEIARLRERIAEAIAQERYEDAIPLRDRVYELEMLLDTDPPSRGPDPGGRPGRPRPAPTGRRSRSRSRRGA
ncbi:MAG: hypothetical protein HY815_13395 [Candidatus Riflebacteria bacterium]|nr:hypothetical protein [Candidatus Riflebacteria bacterium]